MFLTRVVRYYFYISAVGLCLEILGSFLLYVHNILSNFVCVKQIQQNIFRAIKVPSSPIVDFIMSSYRSSQSFTWTFKNGKNIYFIIFSYSSRMKESLWNLKFVFPQEFDFFSWHNISICIHFLEMIGCYIYFKIIHQCITESYLNIFIYLLPLCIGIY